jgi:subtilase family serine protease
VHHVRLRALVPIAVLAVLTAVVATSAAAASPRAKLAGSVPPWAKSANFKSSTSGSEAIGFRVYLGWRGNPEATARAVSTPGSARYGKYLTPQQFRQQFSPSQSDVNTVKQWLTSQGFTIDYTPQNKLYVAAEGTVAQASAAFGVKFGEYKIDGKTLRAPQSALTVPAGLNGVVESVVGLDESSALVHTDRVGADKSPGPAAGFRNAPPCSTYWGEKPASDQPQFEGQTLNYAPCGLVSSQLRSVYGLTDPTANGAGQTVAIIDAYASPTILQDANEYSSRHGLPTFTGSQFSQVTAPGGFRRAENRKQDPQGWWGEETLDVEAVHSMAPAARIVYVGAPNNYQDLDAALNHVVDRHLAQIVTNSYGWDTELLPAGFVTPVENILVQAAAEGIGVYFSSGDNGDETQVEGYATPDWPASSPWVTAVGGTSLGVTATGTRAFETYWGTDKYTKSADGTSWSPLGWLYGGGGGISRLFSVPPWQQPVAGSATGRVVPDVSMIGDPNTGFLEGQTQSFPDGNYYDEYRIGGTSVSSPLFAGYMAVADQLAGQAHGFADPALYAAGLGAYHDIAASSSDPLGDVRVDYANGVDASDGLLYSVRTFGDTLTLNSVPGFDDATGLGTPTATLLGSLSH